MGHGQEGVSTFVGKTKCRDMNGTTPSSKVLTASIEVLYVSIAKDLKLDTKFSILAFSRVFYPICQFKLVLRLEKDSETEQDK